MPARELAAPPTPPSPAITARREGAHAVIDFEFPKPSAGQPGPIGILVTVDAPADDRPPATYSFPVSALQGTVEHPSEIEEQAYEVRVRAFAQSGLASDPVAVPLAG